MKLPIAIGVLFASPAFAGDIVSVGVGLQGHAGGSASTGLSPQDIAMSMTGTTPDAFSKAGPSFGGPTGGIGAMAEIRFIKMLGIEVDYFRTLVAVKGDVPLNTVFPNPGPGQLPVVSLGFQQWQNQLAILGKFVFPVPLAAPFFALGPEFVFPDSATLTITPAVPGIRFMAHAGNYTMLTGVVGIEIKLPLPKIDIRIPVGARLSYNLTSPDNPAVCGSLDTGRGPMDLFPGLPSGGNCRLKFSGTLTPQTQSLVIDYRTEWKYSVGAVFGLAVYF